MKTTIIVSIFFILFFALLAFIFVGSSELFKQTELQQKEIDHWKKVNKEQADSLNQVLKVTQDSLSIAFEAIKQAAIEREAAHLRTQKIIKDLQKIVYIQHTDSSRSKALTQLYKTYTP